jgi:hypothetical protein
MPLKKTELRKRSALSPPSFPATVHGSTDSIAGVGKVSSAELAGEIGTFDQFTGEASLPLYLGMCPLDNQSGQFHGAKKPRASESAGHTRRSVRKRRSTTRPFGP